MTTWVIGLICNAIIAVVYMLIALAIIVPLAKSRQLRTNPLGGATAAIFFTCSVHHGAHSVHMLLPAFGLDEVQGLAMRTAWGWTLRRTYSSLMHGAKLFEDMRQREQQALEINDNVLQGLVVAKMALDLGEPAKADRALTSAIDSASRMITDLLGSEHFAINMLRTAPAVTTLADDGRDEHAGDPPPGGSATT